MNFTQYFQSYNDYFWQWEDDCSILAIPNGNTIAYRNYALEILEQLSAQGLPPFGSLLLVLISTNQHNSGSSALEYLKQKGFLTPVGERNYDVHQFLELLNSLPEPYKSGKKRIQLLQVLFENCHNIVSKKQSLSILKDARNFQQNSISVRRITDRINFSKLTYAKDFRTLDIIEKKFPTVQSILDKIASLPTIEEDLLELEESEIIENNPQNFLEELIENPKTFHIGALIQRIWGGLNIPFHNLLPSQQPMGGFSDLTNKGDFDRLLISEFANDDLILMSRLANNEALYINREVPPQSNKQERIILVDVSIKNWGTPRTIAYALMLAIAKHPKTDMICKGFALGKHYHSLGLNSIDEIIDSLQILEGTLDPTEGIQAFFQENPSHRNQEVFFISTPETAKLPAMKRVLLEYQNQLNYWIYTDSDGQVDLYKRQQNSKKHIQHLQLPLDELWVNKSTLKKKSTVLEPAHQSNYPILFPCPIARKKILSTSDGFVFVITEERNILRFNSAPSITKIQNGGQLICENLPTSTAIYEIGRMENGEYILLIFKPENKELIWLNVDTSKQTSYIFDDWKPKSSKDFFFNEDSFYHLESPFIMWTITNDRGIKIEKNFEVPHNIYDLWKIRQNNIGQLSNGFSYVSGILKNIKDLFISNTGHLTINTHELQLTKHNIINWQQRDKPIVLLRAIKSESQANTYVFPNGSSVFLNRDGVLVLKNAETICYEVFLNDVNNSSTIINSLSENLSIDFNESKKLVETAPNFLKSFDTKEEADKFCKKIMINCPDAKLAVYESAAQAIYVPSVIGASLGVANNYYFAGNKYYYNPKSNQININPSAFWNDYISKFIKNIIDYGTDN